MNHSLCGVLKADGRDCEVPVDPGSRFNICPRHYRAIYDHFRDVGAPSLTQSTRLHASCPACGVRALIASVKNRTATCASCGHDVGAIDVVAPQRRPGPLASEPPEVSVVYYIRFGDRIKIGTTTNLQRRLTALPHDEVLFTEPGSYELEQQRHRQFNRHLIAGREWFEAHPDLLNFITESKAARVRVT